MAVTAHGAANITQQSSRGGGGSSASATKRQGRDTVGFSTYDNNEVSGSSTANEGITFPDGNDLADPFQYLADDDFTMSVDVDGSKFSAFAFGNSLPTPYDPSQNAHLPPSQQEPGQAPWTPFATPSTTSIHGEDLRISGYNVALPAASKAIGGAFNGPIDSPNQATGNEKSKEVHDCEAYALTLLRSLHHWSLYSPDKHNQITSSNQACAVSETYLANSNANPEVLHSLDTILDANKCALSGVVKLLDCSCAQRPHLATLYMSIITKMLSLYEIAATTDISSPDCPSSASPASATQNLSGPRLARNTIIQVGVFDLDEEDQATLQRGILLRQLRKMERAIEKFASLGGGDANDHDISVRQWHSMAVSMIEKELQRIYQNCKERLLTIA
ncbi:hypothetical protein OEA41_003714 [Lepraria neglecta]|uniref:Aflatoxin regulatory protein domain-containing protein n=1 Tax=Lepraria neglecta TaxID=209136 RepID=A0AAD9Z588_9LECA|nr:hypothetical protein OEA41_003714 [Lepraria neglecta]